MDEIFNQSHTLSLLLAFEERDASGLWRVVDCVTVRPREVRRFELKPEHRRMRVKTEAYA